MPSVRIEIQRALVARLKNSLASLVLYDKEGSPSLETDSEGKVLTEKPRTPIACNEESCNFVVDPHFKRGLAMKRENWYFKCLMDFESEVLLEDLETDLLVNPILVTPEEGSKSHILILSRSTIQHPVQQSSGSGTHVEYIFTVLEDRN